MTPALQAQTGAASLDSTARVRAQAGSAIAEKSKSSFWQIELASAKPAGKKAEIADPSESFAHALRQKKREAHKPAEKRDAGETTERTGEGSKSGRKTARKTDERSDAQSVDGVDGEKPTAEADEATARRGEIEAKDDGEVDPAVIETYLAPDVTATQQPAAAAVPVVEQPEAKPEAGAAVLPETATAATAVEASQPDASATLAAAASSAAAGVPTAGQDALKAPVAAAGEQGAATNDSSATPSNIAELDQLLRRRAPSVRALKTDRPSGPGETVPNQQSKGDEPAVQVANAGAAGAKTRTKAVLHAEATETTDVAVGEAKPPEPALASAPEASRPSHDEPPIPFVRPVETKPTGQAPVGVAEQIAAPPVVQAKPAEALNIASSADETAAAPLDAAQPAQQSAPSADASRAPMHVQATGTPVRSESTGGTQALTPQDAAAQFQKALQAQVERGIALAMQQATSAAGAGDVNIGSGGVVLRLHPAHLGQLKVQLKIEPAGKGGSGGGVRARFEASSGKAKAILDGSMDSLKSALEERGLRVDEVVVAQSPRMPEREIGLPMPGGHSDVAGGGAGFAGSDNRPGQGAPDAGGVPGSERRAAAEAGGADGGIGGIAERPVTLGGLPWTVGPDGQIRVDALV